MRLATIQDRLKGYNTTRNHFGSQTEGSTTQGLQGLGSELGTSECDFVKSQTSSVLMMTIYDFAKERRNNTYISIIGEI